MPNNEARRYMIMNIKKGEPFYRVSYTYTLKTLDIKGKTSHDWVTLEKAMDYVKEQKSKGAGKDFKIEKVVTTYELVYEDK